MLLAKTRTRIGPQHHGRKMSLKSFEFAQVEDGYLYELARGYVVVSEVPNFLHMRLAAFIRNSLAHYRMEHSEAVYEVIGTLECKLYISAWESERHPDVAVYLNPPPRPRNRTMWRTWIPELVVEVVSEGSRDRDYTEKRDEYWSLGVKEYWIVDAKLQQVLVLRRGRTQWTEKMLGATDTCETKLLPGFTLPCKAIFDAAGDEKDD